MTSIRQLIGQVAEGRVRIPAFQRGFVWDPDRVAQLMDSIYKGYPFGSLLFWRTKRALRTERDLGPFKLPQRPEDYPVDYVLDGQQRLTSIFGVFQSELTPVDEIEWANVYFDFLAGSDAQESQFSALASNEVEPQRHFPLSVLFDSSKYGRRSAIYPKPQCRLSTTYTAVSRKCRFPFKRSPLMTVRVSRLYSSA
jgi:hypothetical protein